MSVTRKAAPSRGLATTPFIPSACRGFTRRRLGPTARCAALPGQPIVTASSATFVRRAKSSRTGSRLSSHSASHLFGLTTLSECATARSPRQPCGGPPAQRMLARSPSRGTQSGGAHAATARRPRPLPVKRLRATARGAVTAPLSSPSALGARRRRVGDAYSASRQPTGSATTSHTGLQPALRAGPSAGVVIRGSSCH